MFNFLYCRVPVRRFTARLARLVIFDALFCDKHFQWIKAHFRLGSRESGVIEIILTRYRFSFWTLESLNQAFNRLVPTQLHRGRAPYAPLSREVDKNVLKYRGSGSRFACALLTKNRPNYLPSCQSCRGISEVGFHRVPSDVESPRCTLVQYGEGRTRSIRYVEYQNGWTPANFTQKYCRIATTVRSRSAPVKGTKQPDDFSDKRICHGLSLTNWQDELQLCSGLYRQDRTAHHFA